MPSKISSWFYLPGYVGTKLTCAALNGPTNAVAGVFPQEGSLSFWISPSFRKDDAYVFGDSVSQAQMRLRSLGAAKDPGYLRFEMRASGGNIASTDFRISRSKSSLIQLRWDTVETAKACDVLVDGALVHTFGPSANSWTVQNQAFSFMSDYCKGWLADIRLFSRWLSDGEFAKVGQSLTVPGLLAAWDFTDSQLGPEAVNCADSTGNGYGLLIADFDNTSDPKPDDGNFTPQYRSFRQKTENSILSAPKTLTPEFFGLTNLRYPGGTTTPNAGVLYGTVRSHDWVPTGGSNNELGWKHVEASKNSFVWTNFDLFVNTHYAAGRDIIYVLESTPDWAVAGAAVGTPSWGGKSNQPPDSDADWVSYVTQVATRYLGKIKYYQCFNEPESPTQAFWVGTPERTAQLVKLANQTIKSIDPDAKIISPSTAGWHPNYATSFSLGYETTLSYLSGSDGAGARMVDWVDIVGIHLYDAGSNAWNCDLVVNGPYGIRALLASLEVTRPVWVDEVGVTNPNLTTYPKSQQRKMLGRLLALSAALDVQRFMWYSYDASITGFFGDLGLENVWIDVRAFLLSGQITRVIKHISGAVSVTVNGVTRTF